MIIRVHARINKRHPEVSNNDVVYAFNHMCAMRMREYNPPCHFVAAGIDAKGRLLELVGVELENNEVLVYHAMKLTQKSSKRT